MRFRCLGYAAGLVLALVTASAAQDANAIKFQNWDRIATAMVRKLAQSRGIQMQSAVFGGLADLNFDGAPELFAFTDPANCVPAECGMTAFELQGKDFAEVLDVSEQVKQTPVTQLTYPNQKRNGHIDLGFGQTLLTYNGSRYVEASRMPRGSFNAKPVQSACEKDDESDYQFQNYALAPKQGRKTVCGCMMNRFLELGFDQAAADSAKALFVNRGTATSDEAGGDGQPAAQLINEIADTRTACMIQNGWSQWSYTLGSVDETVNQTPLDFATFVPNCAGQDWLVSNEKIGSGDRAVALCGCVARKLAARGWDQASLDGVGQLYSAEIDEDALTAIREDGLDVADKDLDACFGELPKLSGG